MYRILVGAVIIALVIKIIWLIKSDKWEYSRLLKSLAEEFAGFNRTMLKKIEPLKALRKILYSITAILFIILAVTGFFSVLILGENLSGFLLIVHVTIAPIFVLTFTLSLLFYAHIQQFNTNDWYYVSQQEQQQNISFNQRIIFWKKVCFWLFTIISLPAILSIIMSMYPLFGTDGQNFLLDLHRFSVLFLLMIAAIFVILKWSSNGKKTELKHQETLV